MAEKPILFNKKMRHAVREGYKTQTRRVIKPQPKGDPVAIHPDSDGGFIFIDEHGRPTDYKTPQYQVGDLLWMQEPYRALVHQGRKDYEYGEHLIEYVDTKETIKCTKELEEWWRARWHGGSEGGSA